MSDPLLAQSAVDRLTSTAHELIIEGQLYRRRPKHLVLNGLANVPAAQIALAVSLNGFCATGPTTTGPQTVMSKPGRVCLKHPDPQVLTGPTEASLSLKATARRVNSSQ